MGHIAVGTSGWSYDHWAGAFYPERLPRSRWFDYYAACFCTVEVNYTFYRLPSQRTIDSWEKRAPEGFQFALKGSQLITHRLRLRNCEEALNRLYDRILGLGRRLGVILWQLPPDLKRDEELIDAFLSMHPGNVPVAIEFRHPSWLDPRVYAVLERHHAALVWVSSLHMPCDFTQTGPFVYARFHGLTEGFAHDYSVTELEPWVDALRGRDGYAYFNNDALARAPANAALLRDLLVGRGSEG